MAFVPALSSHDHVIWIAAKVIPFTSYTLRGAFHIYILKTNKVTTKHSKSYLSHI